MVWYKTPEPNVLVCYELSCFVSGCNAFIIDLWRKESDPLLQAMQVFYTVGCVLSIQVAKLFLAEREPPLENDFLEANITAEVEFVPHIHPNVTDSQETFESDVENAYFVVGAFAITGTVLHVLSWLHSGCKFRHYIPDTEGEDTVAPSQNLELYKLTKGNLFLVSFLLCLFVFVCFSMGVNFISFGIMFTVNARNWRKNDASNLITVEFISELVSRCLSIVFAKIVHVHKMMIASTLFCLGGTLFMALTLNVTPLSLWIGASLLGLGIGNMQANSLNAGKRLTSQAGVIVSFVLASGYVSEMVAPLVMGYLFDHVDSMWFLYLGALSSVCMLLLLVAYIVVLSRNDTNRSVEQECDVPLDNKTSEV